MLEKTLDINELEVGMYVKDIILKNSSHKVKNQGKVNSERTINLLKKQGVAKVVIQFEENEEPKTAATIETPADNSTQPPLDEETSLEQEFARSCQIYDQATENVKQLFLDTEHHKPLNIEKMEQLAGEITESIQRNEHAITILTRLRQKSFYQWEHAINCGIILCGFSLYLGLKKSTVQEITLGALLHDIGSAKVPSAILQKMEPLNASEMAVVKKHVFWGVDLAKKEGFTSPLIVDMLVNHHERLDGSGYPRGIDKNKITKLSRMTSVVDVYDAMTGDKPYKKGELPLTVFRHLMTHKAQYDQELVQKFIKYMGIHPVGSLVELTNEKLAVVIEGNRVDPLKPKVRIIFSLKHNQFTNPTDCDLSQEDMSIIASVHPDDYEINMNKVIREVIN